ncbi:MAG TPA: hypothetical protein VF761_09425 [Gemmatimonadaceae bacterium]
MVRSWPALRHAARNARCVVLVAPWLDQCSTVAQLTALRRQLPDVPVVVVTTKDADNLRHLARCPVEEIVWLHEAERELRGAVSRAAATTVLVRLAHAFSTTPRLPAVLRVAFAHACRAEQPVRSVAELASAVGRHAHTLWYHWHRTLGSASALRLEDCVDWILLLRACQLRDGTQGWDAVARKLHVHRHTLDRLIRRLVGCTPGELSRLPRSVLHGTADRVLREVIGGSPLRGEESAAAPVGRRLGGSATRITVARPATAAPTGASHPS